MTASLPQKGHRFHSSELPVLPEVSRWRVLEKTQCQCCGRCALCLATCRRAAITHRGKWRFPDTPGLSHFQPETHSCFHLISPLCFPSFCWEPAARYRLSDEHKERALISQRPAIPASLCQQATQSRRHTKAPLVPLLSRKEAPVSNSHREHSSANKLRCSFHCAHYRKDDSSKSVSEPTFTPLGKVLQSNETTQKFKVTTTHNYLHFSFGITATAVCTWLLLPQSAEKTRHKPGLPAGLSDSFLCTSSQRSPHTHPAFLAKKGLSICCLHYT